jgi:hypothetical protein
MDALIGREVEITEGDPKTITKHTIGDYIVYRWRHPFGTASMIFADPIGVLVVVVYGPTTQPHTLMKIIKGIGEKTAMTGRSNL